MSKETYVGGDILEFIRGKDMSFAKDDIVNVGKQVIQNSKEGIIFSKPQSQPKFENITQLIDIYFAEKLLTPVFEETEETVIAKKGENEKKIKIRFINEKKIKKGEIISFTPEKIFNVAKGGEKIKIKYKKKIKDEVSFPKITNAKIKKKVWVVATCDGLKGKLYVEINENKLSNPELVYENPIKFLVESDEKTKLEFDLLKDKTKEPNVFAKEIKLQPKNVEEVKKLIEKFDKRIDKKAYLFLKGEITDTTDQIIYPNLEHEFINKDGERLEVIGSPCYCGVDFTVDQIKDFYKDSKGKSRDLFSHKDCPLPKDKRNYEDFTKELNATMKTYEINSCIRKAHFLAQIEAETFFATSLEYADGWDYDHTTHLDNYNNYELYLANKKMKKNPYEAFNTKEILRSHNRYEECLSFGHNVKGYGPKYKGSGLIQLTWRKTHLAYLTHKGKADLIDTDYPIASDLNLVCDSAGWYWKNKSTWGNLNNYADKDDLISACVGVNGGLNGFNHRKSNLKKILNLLDVKENCINLEIGDKELAVYKYETSGVKNSKWGKNNKSKIISHDDK